MKPGTFSDWAAVYREETQQPTQVPQMIVHAAKEDAKRRDKEPWFGQPPRNSYYQPLSEYWAVRRGSSGGPRNGGPK
jgi:hypothetical protein